MKPHYKTILLVCLLLIEIIFLVWANDLYKQNFINLL